MSTARLSKLAASLACAGFLFIGLWARQTATLTVDGQSRTVTGVFFTTADVLRQAGVSVNSGDRLAPHMWSPVVLLRPVVRLERAIPISIWKDGKVFTLFSVERLPGNLLMQAAVRLYPRDEIRVDGIPTHAGKPIDGEAGHLLQFHSAAAVTLQQEPDAPVVFYSSAATLGGALWERGLHLQPADRLAPPEETLLDGPVTAVLRRAISLKITTKDGLFPANSAAQTVGEALADAGLALQGLDYSQPAEDQRVPADGSIRLVRVKEEVQVQEKPIPNQVEYQADPTLELDQRNVIDAGEPGLKLSQMSVRYEDGVETARQSEGEWVARQPRNRVLGYGTKVVVRTLDTGNGVIQYWRAITAYATSYSPCEAGGAGCGATTASGTPVHIGSVAVIRSWYNQMKGQNVFIPGYGMGTIEDIGGGIPGQNWVDLGYPDGEYIPWHQNVTVYFLIPVPAVIPWILP